MSFRCRYFRCFLITFLLFTIALSLNDSFGYKNREGFLNFCEVPRHLRNAYTLV